MADGDICGYIETGGTGMEWICVKKPHGKVYKTKKGSEFSNNASAHSHYFKRRYTNEEL